MRPVMPSRNPFVNFFQVAPPSYGLIDGAVLPPPLNPQASVAVVSGGVERHRTCRIYCQINHAGVFVNEEHVVPGLPPSVVLNTPRSLFGPTGTHPGRVDNVRIARIDNYAANFWSRAVPVLPGLAGIQ